MKKLLLGICCLFLATTLTFAECGGWATHFFPSGKELASNGIILFEGYGGAATLVKGLDTQYPIYLVSGKHKVRLKVKEMHQGYSTFQAFLVHTEPLEVGREYEILVENYKTEEHHAITKYNPQMQESQKPTWKIVEAGKASLEWVKKPVVGAKHYAAFGCGPAISIMFNMEVKANTAYYIKAIMTNTKTKQVNTYYLEPNEINQVSIGHGMCSGQFGFGEEKEYKITFDLIDLAGNNTAWKGEPIKFARPTEETAER